MAFAAGSNCWNLVHTADRRGRDGVCRARGGPNLSKTRQTRRRLNAPRQVCATHGAPEDPQPAVPGHGAPNLANDGDELERPPPPENTGAGDASELSTETQSSESGAAALRSSDDTGTAAIGQHAEGDHSESEERVEDDEARQKRATYFSRRRAFGRRRAGRPQIGIIGGGIAGLMCATRLLRLGDVDVTVWDKGRRNAGGRSASRRLDQGRFIFDHAAQFFTAEDPRFVAVAEAWRKIGIAKKWEEWPAGKIGVLERGTYRPLPPNAPVPYVGQPTMSAIAEHLSKRLTVRRSKIILRMEQRDGLWNLFTGRGPKVATYDAVVVAHSGKSAAKLLNATRNSRLRRLAESTIVQAPDNEQVLQETSLWVAMLAFKRPVPVPFDAAFVRNSRILSWVCNNNKKLGMPFEGVETWTLVSTRAFGIRNKSASEGTPQHFAERVTEDMLREFEELVGFEEEALLPIFWRAQYWPSAMPLNTLDGPEFVWDDDFKVGMCGDWCVGPGIEGAAISGLELGNKLHNVFVGRKTGESVGLEASFKPITKVTGLGLVSGLDADEISTPLGKVAIRGRML